MSLATAILLGGAALTASLCVFDRAHAAGMAISTVVIWIALASKVGRSWAVRAPLAGKVGVAVLILAVLVGQAVRSPALFPFIGWTMFARAHAEAPSFVEYRIVDSQGRVDLLWPPRLVPTLAKSRLLSRLKDQAKALNAAASDDDATRRRAELEQILVYLARLHLARSSGGGDVDAGSAAVEAWHVTVPYNRRTGPLMPKDFERRLLVRVPLRGDALSASMPEGSSP